MLIREFQQGGLRIDVYDTATALGLEAAKYAATLIQDAIRDKGSVRVLFSAANSQLEVVRNLVLMEGIDWKCVEVFHVDEYIELPSSHPASFRRWIRQNLVEQVHPGAVHYLDGDAHDIDAECRRYEGLLSAAPLDISFLGFGENGHIGFNDPHEANFADTRAVRRVTLDERCRQQQVNEGHWPGLAAVPDEGLTLTCPALVSASYVICCVPGAPKADAVARALEGPISAVCPGSLIRTHPRARLYLDSDSAALLAQAITT